MGVVVNTTGREYWHALLGAGGFTAVPRWTRIGFVGVGLIARYIHTFLAGTGWSLDEIGVFDLHADSAASFRGYLEHAGVPGQIIVHDSAEQLIEAATP